MLNPPQMKQGDAHGGATKRAVGYQSSTALRKELESVAAAERRPLGNLVRLALSDWLAQHSVETRPAA